MRCYPKDADERPSFVEGEVIDFADASRFAAEISHVETGIAALDHVLGGGVVPSHGQLILVTGSPGTGKTTLLIQALASMARRRESVLYIAGEETADQLGARTKTLGPFPPDRMRLLCGSGEIELDHALEKIEEVSPTVAVVDSVQALQVESLTGEKEYEIGSPASIKIALRQLMRFSREQHVCIILVGHVTVDGAIGGPRFLEHMVDSALHIDGNDKDPKRTLVCERKNRFGQTPRSSALIMTDRGLVADESATPQVAQVSA